MTLKAHLSVPHVYRVLLDRPTVKNALNPELITTLTQVLSHVPQPSRLVLLEGSGGAFCAGADLNWMQAGLSALASQVRQEAEALAQLLKTMRNCPVPVLVKAHGAVFGGGLGLLAAADMVIAEPSTRFCFSEAKLGLIPAVISPWVIEKMGYSAFNALTLSASVFDAEIARRTGLIHWISASADTLDAETGQLIAQVTANAPNTLKTAKQWIHRLSAATPNYETTQQAVDLITQCRQSTEGQEGMRAFLEKRSPNWMN